MKKLFLAAALLATLAASSSAGAVTLACDPETTGNADTLAYQEGTAAVVLTPLVQIAPSPLLSCKADLSGFAVGTHNLQVWFTHSVWGGASSKVPFSFTRPGAISTPPLNPRLSP